jgi:hypothetical protein
MFTYTSYGTLLRSALLVAVSCLAGGFAGAAANPNDPAATSDIRATIQLPASVLERYVGYYRVGDRAVLTIQRQGEQLYAQLTGQPSVPIFAQTPASFFYKIVNARIDFLPDAPAQINALVLHQGGNDLIAQRINAAAAQQIQAAVDQRVQGQAPAPGAQEAASQLLAGLAAGAPDYDRMTPELAKATRQQIPQLQALLNRLGAVQSLQFVGVGNQGWDLFMVRHEHGASQLRISVDSSGLISGALLSAGP